MQIGFHDQRHAFWSHIVRSLLAHRLVQITQSVDLGALEAKLGGDYLCSEYAFNNPLVENCVGRVSLSRGADPR